GGDGGVWVWAVVGCLFFSSRRRHTRLVSDWSSDVCSSDLTGMGRIGNRLIMLLPGNPVSSLCAYDFFAGRAIRALGGRSKAWPRSEERRVGKGWRARGGGGDWGTREGGGGGRRQRPSRIAW